MPETEVPLEYRRDRAVYSHRTGEKLGFETRWSEAQVQLFKRDVETLLTAAGFEVRAGQDGDPRGYYSKVPAQIATLALENGIMIEAAITAREPSSSDVAIYTIQNGQVISQRKNHDFNAGEILANLVDILKEQGITLSEELKQTPAYSRIRNMSQYSSVEV